MLLHSETRKLESTYFHLVLLLSVAALLFSTNLAFHLLKCADAMRVSLSQVV